MADINRVILVGRLTRDVGSDERSFGYIGSKGTAKATVSLAVGRRRPDASGQWIEETSYFDVEIWGKQAENLKQYLTKGKQIAVEGSLRQDRWEKDGQKHSKVYVVADNVQLLGDPRGGSRGGNAGGYGGGGAPAGGYNAGGGSGYGAGAATGGYNAGAAAGGAASGGYNPAGGASAPAGGYDGGGAAPEGAPFPEDIPF